MQKFMKARKPRPGGSSLVSVALNGSQTHGFGISGKGPESPARKPTSLRSRSSPNTKASSATVSPRSVQLDLSKVLTEEMFCLVSILEGLESVLALKRGGRSRHAMFRGDKDGVEAAAKRTFKVQHLKQLKALLGDTMDLTWVAPTGSMSASRSTPSVKDLDLGVRFNVIALDPSVAADTSGERGRSITRNSPTTTPRKTSVQVTPTKTPRCLGSSISDTPLRSLLLTRMAEHVAQAMPQLLSAKPNKSGNPAIAALMSHPACDPTAIPPLPEEALPTRPNSLSSMRSSSRNATPVRTANPPAMMTPSPSIRRSCTTYPMHLNPSPVCMTSQSRAQNAASTSPSRGRQTTPGAEASTHLLDDPQTPVAIAVQPSRSIPASPIPDRAHLSASRTAGAASRVVETARRLRASRMQPPLSCNTEPNVHASPSVRAMPQRSGSSSDNVPAQHLTPRAEASPAKTPGKRKRSCDSSKTADVGSMSSTVDPTASSRMGPPPTTPKVQRSAALPQVGTPNSESLGSRALTPHGTPGRCGGTPGPSVSPASRNVFYDGPPKFPARANLFEGKLPLMRFQTPTSSRTPKKATVTFASPAASRSHRAAHTTPTSGMSLRPQSSAFVTPDAHTRRKLDFPEGSPSSFAHALVKSTENTVSNCNLESTPSQSTATRSSFARPARKSFGLRSNTSAASGTALFTPDAAPAASAVSSDCQVQTATVNVGNRQKSDAELLAASIMDDDMLAMLQRNKKAASAAVAAKDPSAQRRALEKVAMPRLPSLFEQLRQQFEQQRSLSMPLKDCLKAVLSMNIAEEGMSKEEALGHVQLLAKAVPDWLTVGNPQDPKATVSVAKMCTGVRQRLEHVAYGYTKL